MNIETLLDLACATVANMIKGKTPEEIRKTFNIVVRNSLTASSHVVVRWLPLPNGLKPFLGDRENESHVCLRPSMCLHYSLYSRALKPIMTLLQSWSNECQAQVLCRMTLHPRRRRRSVERTSGHLNRAKLLYKAIMGFSFYAMACLPFGFSTCQARLGMPSALCLTHGPIQ